VREKKKNRIEILGIAMLVLLISGVCMIPCFKTGLPYGDDQQVHMLRVESILKALKSGSSCVHPADKGNEETRRD
jgi:hypothetical protein